MKKSNFLLWCAISTSYCLTAQELITNGSFESGDQGWDITSAADGYADQGSCPADDGQNYLWFGDVNEITGINNIDQYISQTVALPSNIDFAEFSFRWSGSSDEQDDVNAFDYLYFGLYDVNGDAIFEESISNADLDPNLTVDLCDNWAGGVAYTIDSQYAGQNIYVIFTVFTDDSYPTIFRIDNVSLAATTTTGLSENYISKINVSPNPANEQIIINNGMNSSSQIEITNSDGKVIQKINLIPGKNEINISSLSTGFYFIKESTGVITKIIKQ